MEQRLVTCLLDVQMLTWQAVSQIPCNPEAAFFKEWMARKAGYSGPLGLPVTEEHAVTEGGTAQGFSSGSVLHWKGSSLVEAV